MKLRLRRQIDLTVALLAASVLLPLLFFAVATAQSYRATMREAEARVERTGRVLQEHAIKVFETHRLVIDVVNERLRVMDWSSQADRADLHARLVQLQKTLDQVATITVTDADGRLRASSRSDPVDPSVDLSDRDWFQALRVADVTPPYVSRSYVGRQSGLTVFNVAARAASQRPGIFDGAVAVSVDRSYFETFYQTVEPSFEHAIALVRDDGQILARVPATDLVAVPPNAPILVQGLHPTEGVIRIRSGIDGVMRLSSLRRVGDEPVFVSFAIDIQSVLAPWRDELLANGVVAVLTAAVLLAVSSLAIGRAGRERAATLRWQESAIQLRAEVVQRERAEEQLRQSQKMEAVGRLTGGVAHDFNNLLTVVIGSLELLKRRLGDAGESHARLITSALEGANRAAALTHRLLAFSRQQPLAPEPVDATKLVAGLSDLLRRTLGERYDFETELAEDLWLTLADPNQLENALLNLAVNARDAMPEGGRLTIVTANAQLDGAHTAARPDVSEGPYVLLAVRDTGSGMPPEVVERAFEPFFTTKPVGKGTGLGLSQVYGFAKQSGGHCMIASTVGQGTTITLYLPRLVDAALAKPPVVPAEAGAASPAAGETVLVVEDDALVRQFGVSVLREAGYRVLEAVDGPGALAVLGGPNDVTLLFTDVVLSGPMNGRDLAASARRLRPGLMVLFTTGYTRDAIVHDGRLDEDVDLLGKPFTPETLIRAVRQLIDTGCGVPTR